MTSSQKTLIAGCLLGLLGAAAALAFSRYQQHLYAYYGSEPRQLPIAALTDKSYEDQHWVELTNLRLGTRAIVSAPRGQIDAIRIPVFPAAAGQRPPIQVVLRSTRSRSLEEFGLRLRDRATFRGALIEPSALAASDREQLAASYPGQSVADQIWELDVDFGGPSNARWAELLHSASGGLLVFGVICLFGFVGSCFALKEALPAPTFESVVEARY